MDLGIEESAAERSRLYSYDVGFSFAGASRKLVEAVNAQMQAEDVVTFYDFDQQAFLLAADLQTTLGKVYSESCRYYMVFMDADYLERVWTRFEKDIMTNSNRKNHIIPVLLDDAAANGVVGISTTIGRIDLRDVWATVKSSGRIDAAEIASIKNRCVLPTLEKLDSPEGTSV